MVEFGEISSAAGHQEEKMTKGAATCDPFTEQKSSSNMCSSGPGESGGRMPFLINDLTNAGRCETFSGGTGIYSKKVKKQCCWDLRK
jgi:hypothetical protein